MELTITSQRENLLLKRKEVSATIAFEKVTPSNAEVTKLLAEKLSAKEDAIAVKQILGSFGRHQARVTAYAYETSEQKAKIEPKHKPKKQEAAK